MDDPLGQAHRAQLQAHELELAARLDPNQFGRSAANIDDQQPGGGVDPADP